MAGTQKKKSQLQMAGEVLLPTMIGGGALLGTAIGAGTLYDKMTGGERRRRRRADEKRSAKFQAKLDAENKKRDIARAKKDLAFIKEQNRIAPIRGDIDDIKEAKKKLKNLQGSTLSRIANTASKAGLSKLAGVGSVLNPTEIGMGAMSENPKARKMIEETENPFTVTKKRGGKITKLSGGKKVRGVGIAQKGFRKCKMR